MEKAIAKSEVKKRFKIKSRTRRKITFLFLILSFLSLLIFAHNFWSAKKTVNGQTTAEKQPETFSSMTPVQDPQVKLRKFPFPYHGMLAISSDIDSTSLEEFEEYHRFLNTKEKTPYGEGLGLDIADSAFMYVADNYSDQLDKEGHSLDYTMSYFKGTNPKELKDAEKIVHYFKAGWIDSLHAFGDFSRKDRKALMTRDLAEAAWKAMKTSGFMPKVWINHGTETNLQNFGAYNPKGFGSYQEGDDPKSPYYHTDLTLGNGVMFVWNSIGMSQFGFDNPLFPIKLRDGRQVWGFHRYTHDIVNGKRVWTWEVHELPRQLNKPHLDELYRKGQYSILGQHLGKGYEPMIFNPKDIEALQLLKSYQENGKILVAGTERLLNYARVEHYVRYTVLQGNGKFFINITSVEDPVLGSKIPTLEDIRGLTFYVSAPEKYSILLNSKPIPDEEIQRNDNDQTGSKSIGIKWFAPDYTDYTKISR